MSQREPASTVSYLLDREELLRVRFLKLLTNDRDYIFFALQIDYPAKLAPVDVPAFCDRWEISDGDLYKALGVLRKKDIVVSISNQLNLQLS